MISEAEASAVVIKGSAVAVDEEVIKSLISRALEISEESICLVFRAGNKD